MTIKAFTVISCDVHLLLFSKTKKKVAKIQDSLYSPTDQFTFFGFSLPGQPNTQEPQPCLPWETRPEPFNSGQQEITRPHGSLCFNKAMRAGDPRGGAGGSCWKQGDLCVSATQSVSLIDKMADSCFGTFFLTLRKYPI